MQRGAHPEQNAARADRTDPAVLGLAFGRAGQREQHVVRAISQSMALAQVADDGFDVGPLAAVDHAEQVVRPVGPVARTASSLP